MAVNLMELEPQKISRNLKGKTIFLFGKPKCGKTTLASQFEKSLICGFEQGTNALNNVYVQPMRTWKDWKDTCKQLCMNPALQEKFSNIVIDTADEAYKLCEKYVLNQYGVSTVREIAGFGDGWNILDKEFYSGIRDLTFSGYGIVFISHEKEKKDETTGEETIIPALANRPFQLINKAVDVIAYIRNIPVKKGDNIEYKRFIFFRSPNERFLAGSRYKYIVDKVELSYENFVNAIYDAIDKEVAESGGTATESENPYFKYNYDELIEEAKTLFIAANNEGKVDKINECLEKEFGKPIKFSEIDPSDVEKLAKVIIEIKELI